MKSFTRTILGLALAVGLGPAGAAPSDPPSPPWRFAAKYKAADLQHSPEKVRQFLDELVRYEAPFFAVARHPESGLTYDGWDLDPKTGKPAKVRAFSAASKECLDLALLIKALLGDPLISALVSPEDPKQAKTIAAEILAKKLRSYQDYQTRYPGFAGYMAWFTSGEQADPMKGWETAFPTLDLGEMLWALKLVEKTARDEGLTELAQGYRQLNESMAKRAHAAMYHPSGGVRGRVEVSDPKSEAPVYSGDGLMTGEHGIHEGQMVVLYMSLYGGLTAEESAKVWSDIEMRRVEHPAGTTWQGFWGSPHEEWAYLFLPYRDLPEYRQLFRIREKIRTQNARQRGYPGFGASAHHPLGKGYMSAAGIEGIGSQPLEYQGTYTPYGAFPLLLEFAGQERHNIGLAWLHNMLLGPRLQGPFGAGESGDNAGTGAAPIKTIDVSFNTLLAISGGLEKEIAAMMREDGTYDEFVRIMRQEYQETFGESPLREPVGFALPLNPAPDNCEPYSFQP